MLTKSEIYYIATELLKKYGSRSGILRHTDDLIAEYGKEDYIRISYAAKDIRDTTGLGKYKPCGRPVKNQPPLPKRLRDRYVVGRRYEFTALGKLDSMGWELLVDKYGENQSIKTSATYSPGDIVKCTVVGVYTKPKPSGKVGVKLLLIEPRRQRPPKPKEELEEPISCKKTFRVVRRGDGPW